MAFDSTLDKLKKSLRLHFNWLVYSVAGSEALSSSEIKELKKFKSLPLEEMDFIQKSFFLGRLNSILKKKEYGSIGLSELEEALKSSSLSPVEKLSVKEAQRTAGLHIKTFLSTLEKDLLEQASNANAGLVSQATTLATIQDKVSLALLEKKTWQELAANLSKTFDLDVGRFESLARTELHAAKQKGVTQAIANKVDIFSHSDGVDSNVSVVTHTGRCEDCAALYENADGSPKVFKLSELLANGSNADKSHKRVGSLHGHWKPVVPPTHPKCWCELKYIPPGYAWNGRQLGMIVSKAIGDSKLSPTQKPPGPPPSGPKPPPKVGNVPGQAAPARAGGGAPKPPTGSSAKTNAPKKAKPSGPDTSNATWVPKDKIPEGAQVVKETEHGAYITGGGGNAAKPEEQVHPVQASKDWSKQGHSASTVLDRLKHSELTDVHEMGDGEKGITESYRVSLQDGPRALLKPVAMYDNDTWNSGIQEGDGAQAVPPGTYAKREVAAYHGYNMLGLTDFVPPTTTKEHKGIEHSIQHWQEGFESIHYSIGKGELGKEFVKKHGKEASRGNTEASKILFMALPDDKKEAFMEKYQAGVCAGIIFNHNDQHLGNVIVDAKNWDVKFIDNSMSFGNGMEGCKNEAHMNMHNLGMKLKVPDSLMTKLKNTSLGDVKRALGSHIEDWSVGQTYLRMQYISHLQETEGHLDYEKFKATSGNGMPHDIWPQKPRKAMWGGNDKEPAVKEAIQKEFTRRSKAGLLQNQLFNSFAKQWISDSKKLPDNHPHKIAADELEEIGVFMGDGFIMNPEEYRKSNQHRDFEKTIKPGYPPKDIKSATKLGTSKTIPTTRVNNPVVIARDHAAFGVVQTGPDTEDLSSSDLEPFDDEEELGDDDIEVMSSSPGVKTAKQTPHENKSEMKTAKKSMPRLFISLDGRHGR